MTNFQRVPLRSLVVDGWKAKKPVDGTEVWNLNLDQIESDTGRILERKMVAVENVGPSTYPFEAGTVLYSKLRPYLNKVVVAESAGVATTELVPLRCHAEKLLPKYLAYYLRSPEFLGFANTVVAGAKMPRMVMSKFWAYEIPVPSLAEQCRIVTILDQADALQIKRAETLAQLDGFAHSIFIEMFGDPVTNPKSWPQKKLGELGKIVTGNTPSRAVMENYGSTIEWIKSDNINTPHYYVTRAEEWLSDIGMKRARMAPPSSILVTCIAGSPECIGNSAMTDREVAFNQQINAFTPTSGDAHFFYAQFQVGKRLVQSASTQGMKGLVSKSRFEGIHFIVPPIGLQRLFSEKVEALRMLITAQQKSFEDMTNLFASLQYRAFRGEL